ncbi:hypothetical protein [Desmospora profundinema]|uniref:Metallothionein n=1 Tax=Desmospora profundinema TaxID=1571184 RepID=A0ABU1IK27_9BACL|nr:hypothetical protein [Desmospora profundinema]MDR6225132.1 hypothetical protein [Desmospora profundinema]
MSAKKSFENNPSEGCCGGPTPVEDACCVQDAEAKASGEEGCGCDSSASDKEAEKTSTSSCCG